MSKEIKVINTQLEDIPLLSKNPPNNMENKMVRLANRLAVATLLKAVAKHKQTAAATKLNSTSTIRNFRNT